MLWIFLSNFYIKNEMGKDIKTSNIIWLKERILPHKSQELVFFKRDELDCILNIYGFMVGAGQWRDYALDHLLDKAVFSIFKRSHDAPIFQIVKEPKLTNRQGAYSVINVQGLVLKRGRDLVKVLKVFDRKIKLVH